MALTPSPKFVRFLDRALKEYERLDNGIDFKGDDAAELAFLRSPRKRSKK